MEELKMNRSEIFNFALRRCLYFSWCNNLFLNNSKVLPEISLHIYHAIGPVRKQKLLGWYDSNFTVQIQFKSDDMSTFIVPHIIFHNSRYRYAAGGGGYLNLSSPDVEIFDCRLARKRLRPNMCFPLLRFTHAPYGLKRSGSHGGQWEQAKAEWTSLFCLQISFVLGCFWSIEPVNIMWYQSKRK